MIEFSYIQEWINGRLESLSINTHQNTHADFRIYIIKALGGSNLALEKMRDFACKNAVDLAECL